MEKLKEINMQQEVNKSKGLNVMPTFFHIQKHLSKKTSTTTTTTASFFHTIK